MQEDGRLVVEGAELRRARTDVDAYPLSMTVVPSGEGDALARAALALIDDPGRRTRMAEAARAAVEAYSWSASTAHLESLLRQVV